jgi:transcription antitermination factor NusG
MTEKRGAMKEIDGTEGKFLLPAPDADCWYVCTCISGQEIGAVEALARNGHIAWFPALTKWLIDSSRKRRVKLNRPLFPGYLFVSPKPDAPRGVAEGSWVRWLHGRSEQSRIYGGAVRRLSDMQEQGAFIDWRNAPEDERKAPRHAPGSRVVVEAGPFVGLEGIVEKTAQGRVFVLVEMLGRLVRVEAEAVSARKKVA